MKIISTLENNSLNTLSSFRKRIIPLAAGAVLLAAANLASGQTTYSWVGTAGDFKLATASNWSPSGTPSGTTQDIMQWDGTAATGDIQVTNASALDSSPGLNINVTAAHTGSLTIVGTARLRLCTNSLTIANGVGAFSFGNGNSTTAFPIPLAGIGNGAIHAWTNNSAYSATINSEVYFLMGGGGGHTLTLGGSGNWNVYANLKAQNSGAGLALTVNGTGTVVYAPTNSPGTTYSGTFNGITISSGTFKFGNAAAAVSGPLTVNGGTLDLNGFSITNNLNGTGSVDTTAVGGTPTLTVSNTGNSTVSGVIKNTAGTLSLAKMGPGTLTLGGANTYSGTTTVSAGTLVETGGLGAGAITVGSGATFGGSGTIGGSINWQAGSAAVFNVTNAGGANTLNMTVASNVTLNNNAVTINVPGSTPLPIGTYVLLNATGSTGQFVTSVTSANYTGAGVAAGTLSAISTSGGVVTLSVTAAGTTTAWTTDLAGGTGDWSVGSNWSSNPYAPTNAGDTATLGVGSAVNIVAVDENISLGGITFTNPNSFIIADIGKTLTFDSFGGGATVAVNSGTSNAINTAVSLKDKTTFNVAGGMSLSIGGIISGTSSANTLTKNGNGTLVLSGNNTYGPAAGNIGTIVRGGTLELTNSQALGAGDLTNAANATMTFDTAVILPNKIWINSGSTFTLNDHGNTVAFAGGFGGSGSLTKSGAGLDIITNNGTSAIATLAVNAGILEVASNSTVLANGQCFVDNGSTLQVDSGATLNFNASGYGFIGNTTGVITTNIIYGTFNYSNANFVVGRNGGGYMAINSGRFSCNNFFDGQSSVSDSSYVYLNGGALLVNNIQSGGGVNYFYFNGGTLTAKAASTTFWANNTALYAYVESNLGTIDNGGNAITISQPIYSETGTDGGMVFQGTNVTTLTAANGYNGSTIVSAGTLLINGSTGSGNVIVSNGAAFGGVGTISGSVNWRTGSAASLTVTNNGSGNGTPLTVYGNLTLNNNSVQINVLGSTPLPVGTYTLMPSGGIGSGHFAATPIYAGAGVAGGTVSTVSDDGYTVTLTVSVGGNTWTHDGNGNWSTAADWSANPYIPHLPGDSAVFGIGSALTTITLDTNVSVGGISFTNPGSFIIANAGSAIRTLNMTNIGGPSAINVSAGQSNVISAPIVLNGTTIVTGTTGGTLGMSGGISGTGNLTLGGDGTGVLTLSGANTYSGTTTLSAGTLVFGSTNAIGTNALVIYGGILDSMVTNLANANNCPQIWVGSFGFAGSNNLNLGNGSVTVSNSLTVSVTNSLVVAGAINGGAVTLTLNGSGTLELDGNNSIGGVNSGVAVLAFGSDYAAGTGILNSYAPNAAFASSSSAARTIHNILGTGNGSFGWTFTGTGNLIFDGGVTSYNFGKTVAVNNPVTTWAFALPSGAGGTTKLGAGTLVLAGANGNTGGNTVTEGTLALANGGALGTGALTLNGGNLDCLAANLTNVNNNIQTWNTNFTFLGSQNLNLGTGDVTMNTNMIVTVNANTLTIGGAIGDGGLGCSLAMAGAGTLILDGANTYTGNTVIESGTLLIADPGTLTGGSYSGQIANNGVFNYSSSSAQMLSGVISGTGALIKGGSSLLTLSGNNSYTGNTTVQDGTLELVNPVLYTNSNVAISSGAVLQLDFTVTNRVGALVLNGVAQPGGVYGASTPGGFITGTGFLQVASVTPPAPAHLTNSISGATLSLSWPAGLGWRLQAQTNGLSNGLGANWIYVTDGSVSSVNITMDPTKPTVFYRLANP